MGSVRLAGDAGIVFLLSFGPASFRIVHDAARSPRQGALRGVRLGNRGWSATLVAGLSLAFAWPAGAQSWNMYGNGGSFFVPITFEPYPAGGPEQAMVKLTLNGGGTNKFILDTGSLGLVATSEFYTPGPTDMLLAPHAGITYTTSGNSPLGSLYLTNVEIRGQGHQSVTARVPILASTTGYFHQLGVGFDRPGIQIGPSLDALNTPANNFWNMNPLLSLVSGPGVSTMQPGYMINMTGPNPGITLGLTSQNTSGFALQQLATGGSQSWYSIGGIQHPVQWTSQNGSVVVTTGGTTYNLGSMSQLPDSGISYMIVTAPGGGRVPVGTSHCSDNPGNQTNCLPAGSKVQVFLPGQTQPAYSFVSIAEGNNPQPSVEPFGVQVTEGSPGFTNLGRTYFENLNYLYDPVNGFVGYQASGAPGTNGFIIPMLALQGTLNLSDQFWTDFPTFLMSNLTVQQNGSGMLEGPITGPGGLILESGNLTLGGAANHAGGTTVNGGLLTISRRGSITGDVTVNKGGLINNGTIEGAGLLTVNAGGSFVNNGTVGGSLLTINAGGSLVNNGTIDTLPLQWQLNLGSLTNNGTFNGNLINAGAAGNAGTLAGPVINTTSGMFTNTGTITGGVANMGLFTNNGTVTSGLTNMGRLSGAGTIGADLINAGLLAPGNSIGTMTVAGNYSQTGGTYQAEVNASGQSDRLNVAGTATIGPGSTVSVAPERGIYAARTKYTLLNAAGGVSGAYASVSSLLPFLQPSLSYDANNVYLTLQIGGFARGALTPNQAAVGAVLDATAPAATGDYATVVGALASLSSQQGQAAMNSISGQNYSGFSSSMVQGTQLFLSNFAGQAGGGGSLGGSTRVALAEACDTACDTPASALWGAWGGALGGLGTISNGGSNSGALTYNVSGFAGGLDRLVAPGLRIGATVGYQNGNQWVGGFSGSGNSNTFQAGLYANYSDGPLYADAVAGYAYSANQMWRSIAIPGLAPRTAYGLTGANQVFGQIETGYRFELGGLAEAFVMPFVRLQAYTGTQNAFTETGAGSLNLSVAQQTTNSLRTVLGAQLGGSMDLGWRDRLAMRVRLGWSHEYADTARPVTASFAGAPVAPFTTYGVAPQRDGVVLGLAATTAVAERMNVYARYEGEVSGQDNAHAFSVGVRMTW